MFTDSINQVDIEQKKNYNVQESSNKLKNERGVHMGMKKEKDSLRDRKTGGRER